MPIRAEHISLFPASWRMRSTRLLANVTAAVSWPPLLCVNYHAFANAKDVGSISTIEQISI